MPRLHCWRGGKELDDTMPPIGDEPGPSKLRDGEESFVKHTFFTYQLMATSSVQSLEFSTPHN